ncbi:MAG: ABC transporter permease [bacterium]
MIKMFGENVALAFSALANSKMRSFLTMLGIVIGVFAVITLVSIGNGVQKEFENQVESFGGNIAAVISGDIGDGSMGPEAFLSQSSLSQEDVQVISGIDGVVASAPLMIVPGAIDPPVGEPYLPLVLATSDQLDKIVKLSYPEGRPLNQDDLDQKKRVIIVGTDAAENDFEGSPIGQKVTLLETEFEVIGTIATDVEFLGGGENKGDNLLGGNMPNLHESYYLPITTVEDITETLNIFRIMTAFESTEDAVQGIPVIEESLLKTHKGIKDFSVVTVEDLLDLFDQFFGILTSAVAGIAAISLIVGGIGIMNIMLVSVTERTKEIGLRKAIGASRGNILSQFIIESVILSIVGAIIGIILATTASLIIQSQLGISAIIDYQITGIGIGFSVLIGVIFGVAPAIRASRLNPIDALRSD